MLYDNATPVLIAQHHAHLIVTDAADDTASNVIDCSVGAFMVKKELQLSFEASDMTWQLFVSQPVSFTCTNDNDNSTDSLFQLRAEKPIVKGMIRLALGNNCTTAKRPIPACEDVILATQQMSEGGNRTVVKGRSNEGYMELLRNHSDVFPTDRADISFQVAGQSSTDGFTADDDGNDGPSQAVKLIFDWQPSSMSDLADASSGVGGGNIRADAKTDVGAILMLALPHQRLRLETSSDSSTTGT
jgi:hypothetical protein